jgi:hypothetical protein
MQMSDEDTKKIIGLLMHVLDDYADPEFYYAVMIIGDSPCGDFARDCDHVNSEWGYRHGKKARRVLKLLAEKYPDVVYTTPTQEEMDLLDASALA